MTSLEQIKSDVAALREARADDERWRKLCLEKLDLLETLGDALRVERSDDRGFAENAGIDIIAKLDKSHADLQAGIVSLKGQLDAVSADTVQRFSATYRRLDIIGGVLAEILSAKPKRKSSTKRKPRGRRKS